MKPSPWEGLHYQDACREWLRVNRKQMSSRTYDDYCDYLRRLEKYFKEICATRGFDYDKLTIDEFDNHWMRDYQALRKANYNLINHELSIIKQTRDDMRNSIDGYKPLRKPKDWKGPGKRFEEEEEIVIRRTCKAAADHKYWDVAALCTLTGLDSGLGPGELRNMQLGDVTIGDPGARPFPTDTTAHVGPRGAKKPRRKRTVVLIGDGEWAMKKLVERAHRLGCTKKEHFLLPGMNPDKTYNPNKMCDSWKTALHALQAIAGVKFRKYDTRHHAISVGLEAQTVSLTVAGQHFGHITEDLINTYYHGNVENSRIVAQAIAGRKQFQREQRAKQRAIEREEKKPIQRVGRYGLEDDNNNNAPVGTGTWKYLRTL